MLRTPLDLRCVLRPSTYGLHDDQTPSLRLYEDRSWYCSGCRIGGTIYDFAGQLAVGEEDATELRTLGLRSGEQGCRNGV